jgi:hypothetical protein
MCDAPEKIVYIIRSMMQVGKKRVLIAPMRAGLCKEKTRRCNNGNAIQK